MYVGGENLDVGISFVCRRKLVKEHGQRIGFLARGAAGSPDAQPFLRGSLVEKLGNDFGFDDLKGLAVAKELRDFDEKIAIQRVDFVFVGFQKRQVIGQRRGVLQRHAPLESSGQRA